LGHIIFENPVRYLTLYHSESMNEEAKKYGKSMLEQAMNRVRPSNVDTVLDALSRKPEHLRAAFYCEAERGHPFTMAACREGLDPRREQPELIVNALELAVKGYDPKIKPSGKLTDSYEETFICLLKGLPPLWDWRLTSKWTVRSVLELKSNWAETILDSLVLLSRKNRDLAARCVQACPERHGPLLTAATALGNFEAVKFLLEAGADPNARDNDGYTAVTMAQKLPQSSSRDQIIAAVQASTTALSEQGSYIRV
jgi:hypothetical protein